MATFTGIRSNHFNKIKESLKRPCTYATVNQERVHFEWIFDGSNVYIVQADHEKPIHGINPLKDIVKKNNINHDEFIFKKLELFTSDSTKYLKYSKLKNVYIYGKLKLPTAPLYILNNKDEIYELSKGNISEELKHDIKLLLFSSLMIRVDIESTNLSDRQMLPRTEEVLDLDKAILWLKESSSSLLNNNMFNPIFIFHNFIPAYSSAFAYSEPTNRSVIIESIWGVPEGLYYYSHDVHLIDLGTTELNKIEKDQLKIITKTNFKHYCVHPIEDGSWVVSNLSPPYDWRDSLHKSDWKKIIAYNTRKIVEEEGTSLSVMWLVGTQKDIYKTELFPWYHERYTLNKVNSTSNKKKNPYEKEFIIRSKEDLEYLEQENEKNIYKHFLICPNDVGLLRDKNLITRIGKIAKSRNAVINLEGGILSHAYYQLRSTGALVEAKLGFNNQRQIFNKLVRDGIPNKINNNGEKALFEETKDKELIQRLKSKLVEEAFEVLDATSEKDIAEEIADVMEVIQTLCNSLDFSQEKIDKIMDKKRKKVGGFDKGFILKSTINPINPILPTEKIDEKNESNQEILGQWTDLKKKKNSITAINKTEILLDSTYFNYLITNSGIDNAQIAVSGNRDGSKLQLEISITQDFSQLTLFE